MTTPHVKHVPVEAQDARTQLGDRPACHVVIDFSRRAIWIEELKQCVHERVRHAHPVEHVRAPLNPSPRCGDSCAHVAPVWEVRLEEVFQDGIVSIVAVSKWIVPFDDLALDVEDRAFA